MPLTCGAYYPPVRSADVDKGLGLPLSPGPSVAAARALVNAGKFDEALTVLRPLLLPHPGRTDILFLTGLAAAGASQQPDIADAEREALLDGAIASLHAILINRPNLVRVRLELARAFSPKGEDSLARGHFERVVAGTLGGSGELRRTDYEGNWFPHNSGAPREDRTRILRATVHHRAFTLFGSSPQLVVTNEARDTNAQLYDYKRTRAELRSVRQF